MSSMHPATEAAYQALTKYAITPRALHALTAGLINTTWQVETATGETYILQRLHSTLPPAVNLNLEQVTRFLAAQGRLTPRLVATTQGSWWVSLANATWRLLTYIDGHSFASMPGLAHAATAGQMLGDFHAALVTYTAALPCARPAVHEPARHCAFLATTLSRHSDHRLQPVVAALSRSLAAALAALPALPERPLRLVHGDPKLSNLLFGPQASARCLVDLDTLTRAPLAYELGDALRSWCNPQAEDADHATFDLAIFEAALTGYAEIAQGFIESAEIASIVTATEMIYLELAMRFAADALNESYFGWDTTRFANRGEHNLRRAQNQYDCARALRAQRAAASQIVARVFACS